MFYIYFACLHSWFNCSCTKIKESVDLISGQEMQPHKCRSSYWFASAGLGCPNRVVTWFAFCPSLVWLHSFMLLFLFFLLGQSGVARIYNLLRNPMGLFHFVFQGVSVWSRTHLFSISCIVDAGITSLVRGGGAAPHFLFLF